MVPLGMSFSLQIEDPGLIRVHLSPILDLFGSHWFMLCPWAMSFFQKLCPAPSPPVMPLETPHPSVNPNLFSGLGPLLRGIPLLPSRALLPPGQALHHPGNPPRFRVPILCMPPPPPFQRPSTIWEPPYPPVPSSFTGPPPSSRARLPLGPLHSLGPPLSSRDTPKGTLCPCRSCGCRGEGRQSRGPSGCGREGNPSGVPLPRSLGSFLGAWPISSAQ